MDKNDKGKCDMKWERVLMYIQLGQLVENEQIKINIINININSRISMIFIIVSLNYITLWHMYLSIVGGVSHGV